MASIRITPLLVTALGACFSEPRPLAVGATRAAMCTIRKRVDCRCSSAGPPPPADIVREIAPLIFGAGLRPGYLAPPPLVPLEICPLPDLLTPARQLPTPPTVRVPRPTHPRVPGCVTN
jgi:hypothetical protein